MEESAGIITIMLQQLDAGLARSVGFLVGQLHAVLGKQAVLLSNLRARDPANPRDPPRRVTGTLQSHIGFDRVGICEWIVGIRGSPLLGYAGRLEFEMGHPFFQITITDALPQMQHMATADLGGF